MMSASSWAALVVVVFAAALAIITGIGVAVFFARTLISFLLSKIMFF